jgi:hypothetical protein
MPICSSIKPNGAPAGGLVAAANFSQCAAVAETPELDPVDRPVRQRNWIR